MSIRFGTYNICNGHNGGLASALRGVSQANMDLDIFQETKVKDRIYTRRSAGYTAEEGQCFAGRRHILGWMPSSNSDPTLSDSSWRRGSGSGTS